MIASLRLYIMIKQGPPQRKAKDLYDIDKALFLQYSKKIVHYQSPFSACASYVEKYKMMNTECILVIYKPELDKAFIGYAKMIYSRHPLVRRIEDIEKRINFENVVDAYIVDEFKLSIKYKVAVTLNGAFNGEVKELVVKFLQKSLMYEWLSLIINEQNALRKLLLLREIEPYKMKIDELEKENSTISIVYEDVKRMFGQCDAKKQALQIQQQDIHNKIQSLENENNVKSNQIEELLKEKRSLLKDLQDSYTAKKNKDCQCKQLTQKLRKIGEQLQKHQTDAQLSIKNQIKTEKQFQQKLAQYSKTSSSLRLQNQTLKKQQKEMNMRLEKQIHSKNNDQDKLNILTARSREYDRTINDLSTKIKEQNIKIEALQAELKQKSTLLVRKEQQCAFLRLQGLFVGHALQDYHHHKLFLKDTLESYRNMRILRTRMLFRFDPLNKVNFHNYIDYQPDLLIIVKTTDGAFLAGYSESAISPSNNADRSGLIVSLTNQLVFPLLEEKKSVTYDDYYIIFGNSEIRVKSLELSVFSNFGISNGFYNCKGMGVEAILCSPNREVEVETYEVHRVYFGE